MMDKADLIAFSPDWQSAKGCRVEHELATAYGLNIIEVELYLCLDQLEFVIQNIRP